MKMTIKSSGGLNDACKNSMPQMRCKSYDHEFSTRIYFSSKVIAAFAVLLGL